MTRRLVAVIVAAAAGAVVALTAGVALYEPPSSVSVDMDRALPDGATGVFTPERAGDLTFASVYVPNGGKDYAAKLEFLRRLSDWMREANARGQALVEGIRGMKKAVRQSQANPQGGFVKREAPIDLSNLMPYDPDKKKGTRIARERQGDQLVRRSKRSGKLLQ